jgi:ATP-dependent DNA helicase RecG
MERRGSGLRKIIDKYPENAVPTFHSTEQSFIVTLKNLNYGVPTGDDIGDNVGDDIGENVGENVGENGTVNFTQTRIIEIIRTNPKVSARIIAEEIGIASRNVEENIRILKKLGILERVGSAKGGHWVIRQENGQG